MWVLSFVAFAWVRNKVSIYMGAIFHSKNGGFYVFKNNKINPIFIININKFVWQTCATASGEIIV